MRIAVVGGGPGGLYFARLIRGLLPDCEVRVFERNPADATFGFGVGFSGKTLSNLEAADPETHAAILAASAGWDGMAMRHGGRAIRWRGFGMNGISRIALLELLQEAAADAGAQLHFEREMGLDELERFDVVVASDGAKSSIRAAHSRAFEPSEEPGTAPFMWVGSTGPFERATFCVRTNGHGTFAIHGYPYSQTHVTLVIETDEGTWRRAGFERHTDAASAPGASDEASVRYLEEVFAEDLQGHRLLVNNSKWLTFLTVRNRRWWDDKVVLLGDAAHTAHPSVGSGTKMAMEDAIDLARALAEEDGVPAAFRRYEAERRQAAEHIQDRAARSQAWWETLHRRVGMSLDQLACSYMTRAGAVDYPKLREIAPEMTEAALRDRAGEDAATLADGPLSMPLTIRGRRLAARSISDADEITLVSNDGVDDVDLVIAVERAREQSRQRLIAAELPLRNGSPESSTLELAARLGEAGCDIVALPGVRAEQGHDGALRLSEDIHTQLGLLTLGRWEASELDQAAAEVLAGRVDLVSVVDGPNTASSRRHGLR